MTPPPNLVEIIVKNITADATYQYLINGVNLISKFGDIRYTVSDVEFLTCYDGICTYVSPAPIATGFSTTGITANVYD